MPLPCTIADLKEKKKAKNASAKRRNYESIAKAKAAKGHYNSGRWTRLEHFKFLEALKMFGKEWQKVQQHVFTRTSTQARSHAQKFFVKLDKKQLTLSEFLTRLDIEQLKEDLRLGDAGDSTEYDELQPVIKIANQKHGNACSVMNIALPNAQGKKKSASRPEEIQQENIANEVAVNNMVVEKEEEQIHCGNKRSSMQRKAKLNHAFLHKNYSDVQMTDSFKRRKTEVDEEAIMKIRINNYEVEDNYCPSQPASHHDITGVHAHEVEMRADSDIQEILEGSAPGDIIREEPNRDFNYFEGSEIMQDEESIDELIKADVKPKIEEFSLMPPDNNFESNLNLLSHNQDWKLDSIHFTDSKHPKDEDKIKFETQEELCLLKEVSGGMPLLD